MSYYYKLALLALLFGIYVALDKAAGCLDELCGYINYLETGN